MLGIIIFPALIMSILNIFQKQRHVILSHHLTSVAQKAGNNLVQVLFTLVCLPYEAYFNTDAVLRTLWRMLISHKRLLEWNPSENTNNNRCICFPAINFNISGAFSPYLAYFPICRLVGQQTFPAPRSKAVFSSD